MSKNDPHIFRKREYRQTAVAVFYPCHYRDDNYFYLQYY